MHPGCVENGHDVTPRSAMVDRYTEWADWTGWADEPAERSARQGTGTDSAEGSLHVAKVRVAGSNPVVRSISGLLSGYFWGPQTISQSHLAIPSPFQSGCDASCDRSRARVPRGSSPGACGIDDLELAHHVVVLVDQVVAVDHVLATALPLHDHADLLALADVDHVLGTELVGNGGLPLRSSTLKSVRWMCTGWNQPPDLFSNSQISTSPRFGFASVNWKLLPSTSSHDVPLIVHSPFSRSKRNLRVPHCLARLQRHHRIVRRSTHRGSSCSTGRSASLTTSNAMILSVLVKLRLLAGLLFCRMTRRPIGYFEKSMITSYARPNRHGASRPVVASASSRHRCR